MTGNSCILDTSIVIDLFRGNAIIASRLDSVENICVPSTVAGELFYGAYKSANLTKHLMQIRFFLNNSKLLITDNITAEVYGKIKVALMQKGKPIPENDIWIAALSMQHELPLFSTDNHFAEIDGLNLF